METKIDPKFAASWFNEITIQNYRDLYTRNKEINWVALSRLAKELIEINKKPASFFKLEEIKAIDKKVFEIITDQTIINDYKLITKEYLTKQKEKQYQSKYPEAKLPDRPSLVEIMASMSYESKMRSACEVTEKEYEDTSITHKIKTLNHLSECIENYGLPFNLINERDENNASFNLLIKYNDLKGKEKKDVILLVTKDELIEQYIEPFNLGANIMFDGIRIKHESIAAIKISKGKLSKSELSYFFDKRKDVYFENHSAAKVSYFNFCENVTSEFIKTTKTINNKDRPDYVFPERLKELNAIPNPLFDLIKLKQLCKELNLAHKNGMLYTTAALVRAICDHVPPVFQLSTFDEVASNYKADKNSKSFRGGVKRLYDFFKHVGDTTLHSQIRKKESLPTPEQVDLSKELDFLLQEVCRILK